MKVNWLNKTVLYILLIWAAWGALLIGYQALAKARIQLKRPDYILPWTMNEAQTKQDKVPDQPYLNDSLMNDQVAWDSEYYISIAMGGYDDPAMRTVSPPEWAPPQYRTHAPASMNYAFFPFYPLVMRYVRLPLLAFGLTPIGATALAGVLVSLLGALAAMLALYDLTREELGEMGGLRTAFYLIAFPTGFFLAMVYTEGLFVGLAFGALALLRRKQWVLAAILAACATWTRAVGVALILPLAWAWVREFLPLFRAWLQEVRTKSFFIPRFNWRLVLHAVLALAPVGAFLVWRATLGANFDYVEAACCGRVPLQIGLALQGWTEAFKVMWQGKAYVLAASGGWNWPTGIMPQHQLYYGFQLLVTVFATVTCLLTMRKNFGLSLFGLAVLLISFTNGNQYGAQGMPRYALTVPSMFIVLGSWGKHELFDRIWTIASILLLSLLALLFAFNFWVE